MAGLFRKSDPEQKRNAEAIKKFKKLVREKRYPEALKAGSEYLARVPNNHDVLFAMGGIHYLKKRYGTAVTYFEKALEIGSYDTEVLLLKAYSHQRLGQRQKAVACCERIREVDPKNADVSRLLQELG